MPKIFSRFFKKPAPHVVSQVVFRMRQEEYEVFEKSMPAPIVDARSSDIDTAYRLGVQHVLKKIRDGYVVG